MKQILLTLSLLLTAFNGLTAKPGSTAITPVRVQMQTFVKDKVISGSVTAIATKDEILSL